MIGRVDDTRTGCCRFAAKLAVTALICALHLSASSLASAADAKKPAGGKDAAEAAKPAEPPPNQFGSICQAEVHYYWRLIGVPKATPRGVTTAGARPPVDPILAYYTTLNEQGKVEDDARARLASRLNSARGAALDSCKEEHESAAGCIERRLTKVSRTYTSVDYASRQLMMKSVVDDCHASLGVCLTAEVSPVKCWNDTPPEVSAPFVAPREETVETVPSGVVNPDLSTAPTTGTSAMPQKTSTPKANTAKPPPRPPKPGATPEPGFGNEPGTNPQDNPFSKPFNL